MLFVLTNVFFVIHAWFLECTSILVDHGCLQQFFIHVMTCLNSQAFTRFAYERWRRPCPVESPRNVEFLFHWRFRRQSNTLVVVGDSMNVPVSPRTLNNRIVWWLYLRCWWFSGCWSIHSIPTNQPINQTINQPINQSQAIFPSTLPPVGFGPVVGSRPSYEFAVGCDWSSQQRRPTPKVNKALHRFTMGHSNVRFKFIYIYIYKLWLRDDVTNRKKSNDW